MARYRFGGGIADWTFATASADDADDLAQLTGGVEVTFWDAETGGNRYTDLLDADGQPATSIISETGEGVRAIGQIPPFWGPDGVTRMWAEANGGPRALMVTTDAADIIPDTGTILPPLSVAGTVSTGVGTHRLYNDTDSTLVISAVRASVGTAPTGADLVVDVNRNGSTIYPTQANRPTIPAGANTSGKVMSAEVTELAPGDYLTVDVDQVGSSTPGADLVVQILVTRQVA